MTGIDLPDVGMAPTAAPAPRPTAKTTAPKPPQPAPSGPPSALSATLDRLRAEKVKADEGHAAAWRTVAHLLADDKAPTAKQFDQLAAAMEGLRLTPDDLAADVAGIKQYRATQETVETTRADVKALAAELGDWQTREAALKEEAQALRAKAFKLGQLEGLVGAQASGQTEIVAKHRRVLPPK